jgi:plastocyanin
MSFVHRTWRPGLVAALLVLAAAAIPPVLAANIGVGIAGKAFEPAKIVVAQGDTVTWTVTGSIGEPHTVTSGRLSDEVKGAIFNSQSEDPDLTKLKDNGGTFSFTFAAAGTYEYFCIVHPADMTGEVVVLAPGQSPPGEAHEGVPVESRLIAGGILIATLIVLFGAAWFWRRLNPA